ncbi:TauD/TfdA dioxygenase family protein [Mycobacterium sp. 94-17]|uniref:TauD/TfdA dioxygenase family protein n=1 Tax=Mycobacterium sp. 94-17 TaxID=2986147 RepID=UPI003B63EC16
MRCPLELNPIRSSEMLVYTQEETGRRVLNFSPWFAIGIEGMDQARADSILHRVAAVMVDERYAYFHDWQAGDMVLWDNWRGAALCARHPIRAQAPHAAHDHRRGLRPGTPSRVVRTGVHQSLTITETDRGRPDPAVLEHAQLRRPGGLQGRSLHRRLHRKRPPD